jgi:hypothetical protein
MSYTQSRPERLARDSSSGYLAKILVTASLRLLVPQVSVLASDSARETTRKPVALAHAATRRSLEITEPEDFLLASTMSVEAAVALQISEMVSTMVRKRSSGEWPRSDA